MNPQTRAVLERIEIDPKRVAMVLFILLIIPVASGMIIRAKRPETADKIRPWARRIARMVLTVVVAILLLGNTTEAIAHSGGAEAIVEWSSGGYIPLVNNVALTQRMLPTLNRWQLAALRSGHLPRMVHSQPAIVDVCKWNRATFPTS